jgi:hypothetical protein
MVHRKQWGKSCSFLYFEGYPSRIAGGSMRVLVDVACAFLLCISRLVKASSVDQARRTVRPHWGDVRRGGTNVGSGAGEQGNNDEVLELRLWDPE